MYTMNKHMKRCPTLSVIREMQIKVTISYYFTPMTMAIFRKPENNKCW